MKKHSVLCLGLGVVLSFGMISVGCSGDSNSPVDAGKKDGGKDAGKDGGNGGSTGVGGSGSGGSSTGGNVGSGGTIGSGGSASGGSSGTGGAGGTLIGGSSGTGGSATGGSSGTGGAISVDGGPVDVGGDALDAPMGGNDAAIDSGSVDTGTVTVDSGALDVSLDAPAIDTSVVSLDTGIDISPVDMSGIDGGNAIPCTEVKVIAAGTHSTDYFGTKGNFCFATCDDIAGWGVSNFGGRTLLLINGKEVSVSSVGSMPLPTPKVMGTYTVFQVNGSSDAVDYASIYWWGTAATSCSAPAGGFGLN